MIVTYACFISKFKRIVHVEKYYCYFYLDTKLNPPSIAFLDKRNTRLYNFRSTNIGKINWNYFSQYSVLGLQTADLIVTFLKKGKRRRCHDVFCIWESVIGTSTGLLLRTQPRRSNTWSSELVGIRGLEEGRLGVAVTNDWTTGKISKSHGLPQQLTHPTGRGKSKSRNVISTTDIPYRHANFCSNAVTTERLCV